MSGRPAALFPIPAPDLLRGLEGFETVLDRAHPLRSKHKAALPSGIRRLSEYLTTDREELPRDYMSRPEYLAAYLRWFLPWNLYRQGRLLQGLWSAVLGTGGMSLALWAWMNWMGNGPAWLAAGGGIVTGGLVYGVIIALLRVPEARTLFQAGVSRFRGRGKG